jgi:hypothetical protein
MFQFQTQFNPFGAFILAQLQVARARAFGIRFGGRRQSARASNQNIIVGNTGAVSTGQQSATPVNA